MAQGIENQYPKSVMMRKNHEGSISNKNCINFPSFQIPSLTSLKLTAITALENQPMGWGFNEMSSKRMT